ncbi:MAG: glutamate-5-semialdehyde dehydrogenase [Oscillospiraceae bacterium]|nr:glutamate-5-semialdehyde dehydrogenase [Oscillospiraceae bacterium]MDD4367917.1 glutamate-5-semialdehyde dehydrogenase [Oscillospiraceae bacterium]
MDNGERRVLTESQLEQSAAAAKKAAQALQILNNDIKNQALKAIYQALQDRAAEIYRANQQDLERAAEQKLPDPLVKRLYLDRHKLDVLKEGISGLLKMPDPAGQIKLAEQLDQDLNLYRVTCPIGVLAVIFEARPDALVQIAALAVKSGNAVIMKGGTEALATNRALADILSAACHGILPEGWLHLIEAREEVDRLLALDQYIDLIIPRGSNAFVQYIMSHTRIPVLGHADGVCHTYLAADVDPLLARRVVIDAKTQYVSVCNATETLLFDQALTQTLMPELLTDLINKGVSLSADAATAALLPAFDFAPVKNWHYEYLDLALSVKAVPDTEAAIRHINTYGSHHTDAILTRDQTRAEHFMQAVDSANVFWNCSTRFSDGFRYGFGAEVGVSTSKLHARGPVGLDGLMTYKYKLYGKGQIVADYSEGRSHFTHQPLPPDQAPQV